MILKHVHQMQRVKGVKINGKPHLFKCADPHCSFREERLLLVDKASLCNSCRTEFILTMEDLKRSKPLCLNCSQTVEAKAFRATRDAMKEMFPEQKEEEQQNA
jgi:hypothetical protein